MPAIVAELLQDSLGEACRVAVTLEGLPLEEEGIADIERVLYKRKARAFALTPELRFDRTTLRRGHPRYTWTRSQPR
jgi:hypothetical protein